MEMEERHHRDKVEDGAFEALGYEKSYRRVMKTVINLCLVIAIESPLPAIMITAFYQITYGGYFGLSWGWIIPSILFIPQCLAVAELCSSMPVNGAFYWWTGALAPRKWSRPLAFVVGWTNILAIFASIASFAFAVASSLAFAIEILEPERRFANAEIMGVAYGVVMLWAVLLTLKLDNVKWVYVVVTVFIFLHSLAFIIAFPVTHATQHRPWASAKNVFGTFKNYSDWSAAVAVPMTWFCNVWVNSAWMSPAYVAEGTQDARRSAPKAMLISYAVTAIFGTIVCLLFAFCITEMDVLAAQQSKYPLFLLVNKYWGTTATSAFFLILTPFAIFGGSGMVVTMASQIAAFARDGGLPFGDKLAWVHPHINLPIYAVGLLVTGTFLVLLLTLSTAANNIIYSLSVFVALITNCVPFTLRLFAGKRFVPGPWNYGRWSKPIHGFATVSTVYLMVMEAFPSDTHWTPGTFNYDWVLGMGIIAISGAVYAFIGKNFKGLNLDALEKWRTDGWEGEYRDESEEHLKMLHSH